MSRRVTSGSRWSTELDFWDLKVDFASIDAPIPGDWTLQVKAVDVPAEGLDYAIVVLPDSDAAFAADVDKFSYVEGEDILLTASLREGGIPLSDAIVTAFATTPDGITQLNLQDDGLAGDQVAGDGILSATLLASTCGPYLFELTGTGTSSTGFVTRERLEQTIVDPASGLSCGDEVDSDSHGCTDAQELQPKPDAPNGGGRNPNYFWDFFDVYTGNPPVRDRGVTAGDIGAVVARFGTFHEPPLTKAEALAEALTTPTDLTSYHASADRSGSDPGGNR